MKHKWPVIGALIVSMLALAGCGKKNKEASGEVDPQEIVEYAQKEVEEADAKKDEFLADLPARLI